MNIVWIIPCLNPKVEVMYLKLIELIVPAVSKLIDAIIILILYIGNGSFAWPCESVDKYYDEDIF